MATFIVTYDTHLGRNYQPLYEAMAQHHGVRLAKSVWGINLNNNPAQVRDWVRGLLDDDDTIVVIQVKPEPSWSTRNANVDANNWLQANV